VKAINSEAPRYVIFSFLLELDGVMVSTLYSYSAGIRPDTSYIDWDCS